MKYQSWTIGTSPDCDIVVNAPAVSGHHCRLSAEDDRLMIEDLDSTNGTYVNGIRVLQQQRITLQDRITLGQAQPMPWPDDLNQGERHRNPETTALPPQTVITIGRSPKNTVVLSETNASTFHARLTISGETIRLEDLGSTNGTSVHTVENKIDSAEVKSDDTVFFGSTPFTVSELIDRANKAREPVTSPVVSPNTISKSFPIVAVIAVLTIICSSTIWHFLSGSNQEPSSHASDLDLNPSAETEGLAVRSPHSSAEQTLSAEERLTRSLFIIVASDPDRKTPFRLGTAFAIDSHHLATTASIITAMKDLQSNDFPAVFIYSPSTEKEIGIAEMIVHPEYQSAHRLAHKSLSEYESLLEHYKANVPSVDEIESVKSTILAAQQVVIEAHEKQTTFDIAIVKTNEALPYWLNGGSSTANLRPYQKLKVCGFAFDMQDPYFESDSTFKMNEMSSRVRQLIPFAAGSPTRLLAEGEPSQNELAYYGSPIVNSEGRVVAIYVRLTPSVIAGNNDESPTTYDASLFTRVQDFWSQHQ